jgi:hypothetical protein
VQNQLPMLDDELGFHPNHERVKHGTVASYRGWDGEFGPFFETLNGALYVNYVSIERSDYVANALLNHIRASLTAHVQSGDLIARKQALQQCERLFLHDPSIHADCLVVVRQIDDWATAGAGSPQLTGQGFLFEFAHLAPSAEMADELSRKRRRALERYTCQIGASGMAFRRNHQAFQFWPFS